MDDSSTDECPVCKDTIQNPSEPSPCCRKVFCRSCLTLSTRERLHCPYCRSPVTAIGLTTVVHQHRVRMPRFIPAGTDFSAARPVGSSIQNRINQLRQVHTEVLQTAVSLAVTPSQTAPSPTAPAQAPAPTQAPNPFFLAPRRPTPAPRFRARAFNLTTVATPLATISTVQTPPAPVINPFLNEHIPVPDDLFEDMLADLLMSENPPRQPASFTVRTFCCPYCQEDGLDDLDLRDHCNANHYNDPRHVVCPVCVSLPHGDPLYQSRDFIGHLNLRHCYYISDMTNVHQSDDTNLQTAILNSIRDAHVIPQ